MSSCAHVKLLNSELADRLEQVCKDNNHHDIKAVLDKHGQQIGLLRILTELSGG